MTQLLLIRHAESTLNAAGLWQGQADPPLSGRGRAQARRLAGRLAGLGLSALVTSDLARARETAEILGRRLGLSPVVAPGLREMDVGVWSALAHAEIQRRWPEELARFRAGAEEVRPGGGETRLELRARVAAALRQVERRWPQGAVGVVTHMGVVRSLVPGAALGNGGTLWLEPSRRAARPAPARAAGAQKGRSPS